MDGLLRTLDLALTRMWPPAGLAALLACRRDRTSTVPTRAARS